MNIKLTPAEWEIMNALWQLNKAASVRDVLDCAYPNGEKAYTTIQTLIKLIEKKGVLTSEKIGLVNFYTPVYSREQLLQSEMDTIVDRLFQGSAPAMASFLFNSSKLSRDELDSIKQLIAEKEQEFKGESS